MKYEYLRKKYSRFIYQKYSYKIQRGNLKISFLFEVPPNIKFEPKITIENIQRSGLWTKTAFDNLVFHLGLIEIPSYWKATCSPIIEIRAGFLNSEQIKWWRDLIINGMGQFFYENKIDFTTPNFLKIKKRSDLCKFCRGLTSVKFKNRVLVPIGGGKDSIVTLEKLKHTKNTRFVFNKHYANAPIRINCFSVNPNRAAQEIMRIAGYKNPVIVKREIDPLLLELNKKGYLNGHTPITAVISFLSVLVAVLFNYKNIAFSNEKSADEGNAKYLGKIINHQWSKSSEFEKKFKNYCQKYLVKGINYFSFLRKYTELEIAKMFTRYPKYFSIFSSCNVVLAKKSKRRPTSAKSSGEARWCGNCPKCLFVYASLYPFLERKQLLKIFGRDIFENKKLLPIMYQLVGGKFGWAHLDTLSKRQGLRYSNVKPFECVGTFKESKLAFQLCLQKAKKEGKIPWLLSPLVKSLKLRIVKKKTVRDSHNIK